MGKPQILLVDESRHTFEAVISTSEFRDDGQDCMSNAGIKGCTGVAESCWIRLVDLVFSRGNSSFRFEVELARSESCWQCPAKTTASVLVCGFVCS